jgi:hypothetical protein
MARHQRPPGGARIAVLAVGLVLMVVGLFAGAGLLVRKDEPPAPVAVSTRPVATAVTPSRNPRREPDVDRGMPLDHGVYVEVADGWAPMSSDYLGIRLTSWERGAAAYFYLSARPMRSSPLLRPDAQAFAELQEIYAFQAGRVRKLPPPNLNIVEAAAISFTGRRRQSDGATYSLTGECVRLRGAAATNDVSVSVCWAAHIQDLETVRPEVQQMIASAARSI